MDSYTSGYLSSRKKRTGETETVKTTSRASQADREYTQGYLSSKGVEKKISVPTGYQMAESSRQTLNNRVNAVSEAVSQMKAKNQAEAAREQEQQQRDRDRLNQLRSQKGQLEAGLALDQAASLDSEISALEKKLGQTLPQRIGNTFSGAAKQMAGGYSSFLSSLYEAGQTGRSRQNQEYIDEQQYRLERAERDYEVMLQQNRETPGKWSESDLRSTQNIISDAKMRIASMQSVIDEGVQEKAADASHKLSSDISYFGAMDLERAKEDLDPFSGFLVDTGAAGLQMLGDFAVGAPFGLNALPSMFVRSAGGGVQEARESGATQGQQFAYGLASGALSVATEKISNIAGPFKSMFGEGVLDNAINKAVNKLGNTAVGQLAASAISEGSEEFIESLVQPVLQRAIYDPDASFDLGEALYEAAVGGALGLVGGGVELAGKLAMNDPELYRQQVNDKAIEQAYTAMLENGMFSPQAKTAMEQVGTAARPGGTSEARRSGVSTDTVEAESERYTSPAMETYNKSSLARAADAFGEQGKSALQRFYDGESSAAEYYGAFSAYYQAGVNGTDIGKVKSRYRSALNEPQRQAAYLAGKTDAEASLSREKGQSGYATVYGEEAGFVPNEYSKGVDRETADFYQALGKATGTKITIAPATGSSGANGWYRDGTVYIAQDADNSGFVVAKHEITHRLQEIAPEQYRQYRDYAVQALSDGSASLVEQYRARYADAGVNLSAEQAMDEIAADFTEALFTDQKKFSDMVGQDRTLAQKVLDAVRDFIRKVKRALTGKSADQAARDTFGVDLETLEEAARLWEEALHAGSQQISAMTEEQQRVEFSDVNTRYSLREKDPPKKTGVAYKVFYAKNGELYPPMVANPGGAGTPVGVWLDADVGQAAPPSKTGRAQVQAGGRGTNAAKGSLAFRPGWHLGDIPLAKQFARKNPATGVKDLFPADFVWAECEYAMDVDYQEEAMSYGYTENGKFRHSYAGLPKLPTDGYYRYRTNPNPDTVPWIITGAMRVTRILTDAETDAICRDAGVEPMQRQGGPLDEAGLKRLGLEAGDVTGNTRFSMKSAVEDNGTLLALHNLTEDKLRSALRLGGFPMPSIAVTRADIPHVNFGDITLVMSRQTVDPRANRRNTVYSADAWTPTFPAIEYDANPQAERRISRRIGELSAQVDPFFQYDLRRVQYGLDDYLNRHGGEEGLVQWVMDNYGLKAAYLEEQGQHIAAVTTQREADRGYNPERAEQYQAVADALGTTDPETIGSMNMKDMREQYGEALERAFPGMTKSAFRMSGILRKVQAYFEDQSGEPVYETVTDGAATRRAVDEALDRAGYERWVRELYSGIEGDSGIYNNKERFTPSGNRRTFQQTHYPVTLENIVKSMKGQNGGNSKNVSGFFGVKSLRAGTARRFKNIADMHSFESRLQNLTEEETKAINDALDERLIEITGELAEKSPGGAREYDYHQADTIGNILVEIADGGTYTIDSIMRKFNEEYGYRIFNELSAKVRDLLFDVSQMPVNLFEAKPERAVGFDEVLAAVVPDDSSTALKNGLEQAGIRTLEYKAGDDADRLAKVNSVEGAKFSQKGDSVLRENAALREENRSLRDRVDYWKGQTRRTQRITTDKKAVQKAARELVDSYSAEADAGEIAGKLQSLYDYIASGSDGKDELTFTEARRRSDEIARELVETAVEKEDDIFYQYKDLRDYLRRTKLSLSQQDSLDIADYGQWRKSMMGKLNLVKGETNIDQVYEELGNLWPEFFDPQREINPVDQLLKIAEVADSIYKIQEFNPYSQYMEQAISGASNEILEKFFDLPQTKKTFADRQAFKLQEEKAKGQLRLQELRQQQNERILQLREQSRERVKNAIEKERERRADEVQKLKDRYKAKDQASRERRTAGELRNKIIRHTKKLSDRLLSPTDKKNIPERFRGTVAAVLNAINQESLYTVDPETGRRTKGGEGSPTKRTEAFLKLREQYAKIAGEEGQMVIDPDLLGDGKTQGSFDAVISMGDTPLANMTTSQLETVWKVVKSLEHSISTYGKVMSRAKFKRTEDWANALQSDTAGRRTKRSLTKNHVSIDLENPYTFFSHYGEAGKAVYRMLRDAQDRQTMMVRETADQVRKIVSPKTARELSRTDHDFTTLNGDELVLTTAQIMELYELMKRPQAKDHILKGGIVQPEVESRKIRTGTDAVLLTLGDVEIILSTLSDREIEIADQLQQLTAGLLAGYGNEASMKAYGYRKFTEKNYWPIQSAKSGVNTTVEKGSGQTRSIKNIGMAKATVPHANNPVDLPGIFDTFSSHAGDMIDYSAWLLPMEDASRLYNFRFRDGEGNYTGRTVKGILDRAGGQGAQRYWLNLMEDIQNGINAPGDSPAWDLIGRGIGSFKGAAVGGNARVVIQQPTAFFRAGYLLSPVDMAKGIAKGVTRGNGWEKALKWAPVAVMKDMGSFDISSPRTMGETLFDTRTKVRKVNDALSSPAAKADAWTWGKLWNACEWATAEQNPSLGKGSRAFYQKTAELFTEVIDQTQVVDGVLQRSNIMRSSNAVVKQATSFMGEPTMALNMMMRAYDQFRYEQDPGKRAQARKAMGRAAGALIITNIINAAAQSVVDGLRDDDEDKKYLERFMSAFTGLTGEEETTWDKAMAAVLEGNIGGNLNVFGQIPFVKDILSILQGYDVSRTEFEIVSDFIEAGQTAADSLDGTGKKSRVYAIKKLLDAGAKFFGIPLSNLSRDMWGAVRSFVVETDNIPLQYEMEKAIYNLSSTGNKSRYYDIMFRALTQGDFDSYEKIRRDLINEMGLDGASIDSAMKSRYNTAVSNDKSFSMSQRAKDLIGVQKKYSSSKKESENSYSAGSLDAEAYENYARQKAAQTREMTNALEQSAVFRDMTDEQKDKAMSAVYSFAGETALQDNSDGNYTADTKWIQQAIEAEEAGIEPWEFALFKAAYDTASSTRDEDGDIIDGESKSDHVRDWLEEYGDFTEEQRELLWSTAYQSKW